MSNLKILRYSNANTAIGTVYSRSVNNYIKLFNSLKLLRVVQDVYSLGSVEPITATATRKDVTNKIQSNLR